MKVKSIKKISTGIALVSIISLFTVGCGNEVSNTNDSNKETTKNSQKNDFETCNILKFENLGKEKYDEYNDDYENIVVDVKNDSKKDLRDIQVTFGIYDKSGKLIKNEVGQIENTLKPNSVAKVECMVSKLEDNLEIKVDSYSYYINEKDMVEVDLIGKVVQFYETLN